METKRVQGLCNSMILRVAMVVSEATRAAAAPVVVSLIVDEAILKAAAATAEYIVLKLFSSIVVKYAIEI